MKKIILTAFMLSVATQSMANSFISPVPAVLTPKEIEAIELRQKWEQGTLKPITTQGGKTSFVYGLTNPTIIVAPLQASDLELEAGEVINNMVVGDNARWQAEIVFAGTGDKSTPHVIFKVLDAGLKSSAVIVTDRRAYHINLKSDPRRHMPHSGFIYPEYSIDIANNAVNRLATEKEKRTTVSGLDLASLNFEYKLEGETPWKPERVFDDGIKTYIQFPKNIQETPILLVKTTAGQGLVNYRYKDKTIIADRIFKEAYLVVGVGKDQEKITIESLKGDK